MGRTWALPAPDGPHIGPMNLVIREVPAFKNMRYPDSLRKLSLPTLEEAKGRHGRNIQVAQRQKWRLTAGSDYFYERKYNTDTASSYRKRAEVTIKPHSFTQRIINDWNSLPGHVVSAPSMNAFEKRLDAFWKYHTWLYGWEVFIDASSIPS